jgi:NADPH2:quinone reductase
MKAVVAQSFGAIEAVRVQDWPDPVPGDDEVVVDVMAAGVNFSDLLVIGGQYQVRPPLPFVPGEEAAGIVSSIGRGVRSCAVGDRVLVLVDRGAYGERVAAPQASCFVLPRAMDFLEAAGFGLAFQTAYYALVDRANLQRGEVVLVTGAAGGVGLACVQLAKALGARVLAGVGTAGKERAALAAGADAIVDLSGARLRDSIPDDVRAHTGGNGADVVVEIVGGDVFEGAFRSLAWRGRLVVLGFAGGRIPSIAANRILLRNVAVIGLNSSDYRERRPQWMRQVQSELFALHEKGLLRTELAGSFPLQDAARALVQLRDRRTTGKLVLTTDRWQEREAG